MPPEHHDEPDQDELPDWRDAGLPRYRGGTHRRPPETPHNVPLDFLMRAVTVVPFVILGVLVFLAAVSLLVIVVFGQGRGSTLLSWLHSHSAGQIALGLLELLGLEAAFAGLLGVLWLAVREGVKERSKSWFWPVSLVFGLCGAAAVLGTRLLYPHALSASMSGHDWLAPLVLAVYLVAAAAYRMRRR